jgi:hypothetical protein
MSPRELLPHPTTPAPQGLTVAATIDVADSKVSFMFRLTGAIDQVTVPGLVPARRMDRLWERTCFEAFLAPAGSERYLEFNFSPSTEWAAYEFDGYRRGMRPVEVASPAIEVKAAARSLVVTASVDLAARDTAPSSWRVGLATVVATAAGQVSYWALEHPRPRPDFHDTAGWVLAIEGTTR